MLVFATKRRHKTAFASPAVLPPPAAMRAAAADGKPKPRGLWAKLLGKRPKKPPPKQPGVLLQLLGAGRALSVTVLQTINLPLPLLHLDDVLTASEVRAARPVDICDVELREQYGRTHSLERLHTGRSPSGAAVRAWERAEAVLVSHDGDVATIGRPISPADGRPITPADGHGRPKPPLLLVLRFVRPHDGVADGFSAGFTKGLDEEVRRRIAANVANAAAAAAAAIVVMAAAAAATATATVAAAAAAVRVRSWHDANVGIWHTTDRCNAR